jgi:hypothetical protein
MQLREGTQMIVGYAKVSTDGQSPDQQQSAVTTAAASRIFAERALQRSWHHYWNGVATVVTPLPWPIEAASMSVMKELRDHTPGGFMGKREHTPDKPLGVTRLLAGLHCKDAAEPDCDPARQSNRARQYPCDWIQRARSALGYGDALRRSANARSPQKGLRRCDVYWQGPTAIQRLHGMIEIGHKF